jgi:hypothetical protein
LVRVRDVYFKEFKRDQKAELEKLRSAAIRFAGTKTGGEEEE